MPLTLRPPDARTPGSTGSRVRPSLARRRGDVPDVGSGRCVLAEVRSRVRGSSGESTLPQLAAPRARKVTNHLPQPTRSLAPPSSLLYASRTSGPASALMERVQAYSQETDGHIVVPHATRAALSLRGHPIPHTERRAAVERILIRGGSTVQIERFTRCLLFVPASCNSTARDT